MVVVPDASLDVATACAARPSPSYCVVVARPSASVEAVGLSAAS